MRETLYLAEPESRIRPLTPLPLWEAKAEEAQPPASVLRDMPPLIKGYLRCGAKVLGPPSFDRHFNTADLPIMMRLADLPQRYIRQFLACR